MNIYIIILCLVHIELILLVRLENVRSSESCLVPIELQLRKDKVHTMFKKSAHVQCMHVPDIGTVVSLGVCTLASSFIQFEHS